jgi:hypothetical protein
MNWKQLYTSATPAERCEAADLLLQAIEYRQHKWVFSKGRLLRERRRAQIAHFINDRRRPISWARVTYLAAFGTILWTLNLTLVMVVPRIELSIALPLVALYELGLLILLYFKPQRRLKFYHLVTAS